MVQRSFSVLRLASLVVLVSLSLSAGFITGTGADNTSSAMEQELSSLVSRGQLVRFLNKYDKLSDQEKQIPQLNYLAGYTWSRLDRPDKAEPFLKKALEQGFSGYPGWTGTSLLLGVVRNQISKCSPAKAEAPRSLSINAGDNFEETIERYNMATPEQKKDPATCYSVGKAFLRLGRLDEAEPLFKEAQKGGFTVGMNPAGYKDPFHDQRTVFDSDLPPAEVLSAIEKIRKATPPLFAVYPSRGNPRIRLYAESPGIWAKAIARVFPQFITRANEAFGESEAKNMPPNDIIVFENRATFDKFVILTSGKGIRWAAGHGITNVPVLCRRASNGQILGGDEHACDVAMHEYAHSLFATHMGGHWRRRVPSWLNEGVADYFARPYSNQRYVSGAKVLSRQTRQPPSYETLCGPHYYDDPLCICPGGDGPDLAYDLAREMVQDLLSRVGVAGIGKIGDAARLANGVNYAQRFNTYADFEEAISKVCGMSGREAYQRAISRYWGVQSNNSLTPK